MEELEEDFFDDVVKDISKVKKIANFQSEIPRDTDEEALIDYVADSTDEGFRISADKAEEVNKGINQAANEFMDQKINDILDEAFSKWKES